MGCLFVIVLGVVSAAAIYFLGYAKWVIFILGLLWLVSMIASALLGHVGFGGKGNTDLQIVIAGLFITAAIILPNYVNKQHCDQAKTSLQDLAAAESSYFAGHNTYATELDTLQLTPDPNVQVMVIRADGESFTASASHRLCDNDKDGAAEVFTWESAQGGLQ